MPVEGLISYVYDKEEGVQAKQASAGILLLIDNKEGISPRDLAFRVVTMTASVRVSIE